MDAPLYVAVAVFGLIVGSFLNVVIHRVPRGESIVRPRSHCPSCDAEIAPRDNIPVLSWLLLGRRCRHCRAPISARYPLVEALTAVLFVLVTIKFGDTWALPAFLVFTAVLIAITGTDLEHKRIPTPIVWTGLVLGVVLLTMATAADDLPWWSMARAAIGAVACGGAFLAIALAVPRGMGMGDVRLVTVEGLYLGWLGAGLPLVALFLGFLIGSVVGIGLMVAGRAGRKTRIPFGPFLAAGGYVTLIWGQSLLDTYRGG